MTRHHFDGAQMAMVRMHASGAKPTNFGGFHAHAIPDTSPNSNLVIAPSAGPYGHL